MHRRFSATSSLGWALLALSGCQMAADGLNLEGVRQYQQGQYSSALQNFQRALANDPNNADAYYNQAATLHRMGVEQGDRQVLEQAEDLYNRCLDLDPRHADCYRGLAVLLVETRRHDRAFKLIENWVAADPQVADAHVELARLYEEFGDLDAAKLHLNEALMKDRNNHRAWAALGKIRERAGEYEQALANYQRAYQLNQFQTGVAERIASLQQNLHTAPAPAGGTRVVTRGAARF